MLIIAQARPQGEALEGVATGISGFFSNLFSSVSAAVEERPYLLIVLAVVLFLLLKKRR